METKDMKKEQSEVSAATTAAPTITADMVQQYLKQQEFAKKSGEGVTPVAIQPETEPIVGAKPLAQSAATQDVLMQQFLLQQMANATKSQQQRDDAEAEKKKKEEALAQKQKIWQEYSKANIASIKGLAGSWMMLVVAIACTVSLACSIAQFAIDFSPRVFAILGKLIPLSIYLAVTIGVWKFFMAKRKADAAAFTSGVNCIKGAISFYKFLWILIFIFVCVLLLMFMFFSDQLAKFIDGVNSVETGAIKNEAAKTSILVSIVLLLVFSGIDALILYFFRKVKHCLSDAEMRVRGKYPTEQSSYKGLIAILCVLGFFSVIALVGSAFLGEVSNELSDMLWDGKQPVSKMAGINQIVAVASGLATGVTYVFGAILVSKYNNITKKIAEERASLEI